MMFLSWESVQTSQGNCSVGEDNSASCEPANEFDCANRIKLKVCQCVNRRSIVPSLLLYVFSAIRVAFTIRPYWHLRMKLMANSWVGIVKEILFSFSRNLVMIELATLHDYLRSLQFLSTSIFAQSCIDLCRLEWHACSYKLDFKKTESFSNNLFRLQSPWIILINFLHLTSRMQLHW